MNQDKMQIMKQHLIGMRNIHMIRLQFLLMSIETYTFG